MKWLLFQCSGRASNEHGHAEKTRSSSSCHIEQGIEIGKSPCLVSYALMILFFTDSPRDNKDKWASFFCSSLMFLMLDITDSQAEQWVNNMSKGIEDAATEVQLEGRPSG